jgi:hypothetical protein
MGNFFRRLFSKKTQVHALEKDQAEERDEEQNMVDDEYEEDVQDAANLAISMQQGDDTTNYELTISCEGLPKMDFLSLTDPMVVVYTEQENGTYREVGKTEVIQNNLDPVFVKNFILPYSKTKSSQKIKFEVYDIDNEAEKDHLEKQEYIGMVEIPFEELVISQSETLKRDIIVVSKGTKKKQKNLGKLCVKAFESDIGQSKIWFVFGVEDFITRNFISMYIKGSSNNKEYFVIHNTPKMKNTSDGCIFPKFSVNSNKIGDESSNLKFEFYEIKKNEPKLLGDVEISLVGLHNNSNKRLNIYRNNLVIGKLKIIDLIREKKNTFLNYIYDGYSLKLIVATDLTLKYAEDRTQGAVTTIANYTSALKQTTELLKFYDDDERTISIGFGAKMPPYFNVVSHNFAINGNYFNPCVKSIDQLCETLEQAAQQVRPHGPVIISEILRYAGDVATHLKRSHPK